MNFHFLWVFPGLHKFQHLFQTPGLASIRRLKKIVLAKRQLSIGQLETPPHHRFCHFLFSYDSFWASAGFQRMHSLKSAQWTTWRCHHQHFRRGELQNLPCPAGMNWFLPIPAIRQVKGAHGFKTESCRQFCKTSWAENLHDGQLLIFSHGHHFMQLLPMSSQAKQLRFVLILLFAVLLHLFNGNLGSQSGQVFSFHHENVHLRCCDSRSWGHVSNKSVHLARPIRSFNHLCRDSPRWGRSHCCPSPLLPPNSSGTAYSPAMERLQEPHATVSAFHGLCMKMGTCTLRRETSADPLPYLNLWGLVAKSSMCRPRLESAAVWRFSVSSPTTPLPHPVSATPNPAGWTRWQAVSAASNSSSSLGGYSWITFSFSGWSFGSSSSGWSSTILL